MEAIGDGNDSSGEKNHGHKENLYNIVGGIHSPSDREVRVVKK